jgi:monothiol glutaredoxin
MPNVDETIRTLVTKNRVVLFMKGTKSTPQCGFSAQVVDILNRLATDYETVNVLADQEVREAIKRYSDWPTIPQLYIDGKFVGGCDIVREMHASGELATTLGLTGGANAASQSTRPSIRPSARPPSVMISLTPRAVTAIDAAREAPGEDLRVVVTPSFEYELYFDAGRIDDVLIAPSGVRLRLDPDSASRADGLRIDFVDTGAGGGFKIDNPNAPPKRASVKSMTAKGLRAALDAKAPLTLFDVRTDGERQIASVSGAIPLDDDGRRRMESLPKTGKLVFMCHHGMRSRVAAEAALRQGFVEVYNLEGGIDAWSTEVDGSVPRY